MLNSTSICATNKWYRWEAFSLFTEALFSRTIDSSSECIKLCTIYLSVRKRKKKRSNRWCFQWTLFHAPFPVPDCSNNYAEQILELKFCKYISLLVREMNPMNSKTGVIATLSQSWIGFVEWRRIIELKSKLFYLCTL